MSMKINQPSNVIRLTNVSLVRLKKDKKRFEIACYKNKVMEWRSGVETDLDNVLQIPNVFLNVSKGQVAPKADLARAFGADASLDAIILEILRRGEVQVGEQERALQLRRLHNEVVGIVASRLINPRTMRVYTTGMIDKALEILCGQAFQIGRIKGAAAEGEDNDGAPATDGNDESTSLATKEHRWTGVTTTKNAKSQALEAMKALIAHQPIPVMRARMRLRITCSTGVLKQAVKAPKTHSSKDDQDADQKAPGTVKDKILSYIEQVETQDVVGSEWEVVGFVEPGAFKHVSDFIGGETKGQGRVEVLDMAVIHED